MAYNGLIGGVVNIPESGNPTVKENGVTFYNGTLENDLIARRDWLSSFNGVLEEQASILVNDVKYYQINRLRMTSIKGPRQNKIGAPRMNNEAVITNAALISYQGTEDGVTNRVPYTIGYKVNEQDVNAYVRENNSFIITGKANHPGILTDKRFIMPSHRQDVITVNISSGPILVLTTADNKLEYIEITRSPGKLFDITELSNFKYISDDWTINGTKLNIDKSSHSNLNKPIQLVGGIIHNNKLPVLNLKVKGE